MKELSKTVENDLIENDLIEDYVMEHNPVEDYIRKKCSIKNNEHNLYDQIVGYFEDELYLPKEKDFLDKCFEHVKKDKSSDEILFSIFSFWKADCYLKIKDILKQDNINIAINNIMFCIDNYCRKIGYDGLKCYLSYNGKKLEVKLVFDYLNKNKHEIELFVFVERPYSDVMKIIPLNI